MVKDHSDSKKGNPLPPHRLLFPINSKVLYMCVCVCVRACACVCAEYHQLMISNANGACISIKNINE